jgi:hypothetical protein
LVSYPESNVPRAKMTASSAQLAPSSPLRTGPQPSEVSVDSWRALMRGCAAAIDAAAAVTASAADFILYEK